MTEPTRHPRVLITPIQWVIGFLGIVVTAGLLFVTWRTDPKLERLDTWYPPGATFVGYSGPGVVLRASGSVSNTTMWYASRLGLGFGGTGASFHYRSGGLTPFSKRVQRGGVNRVGAPGQPEATTFMVKRAGQLLLIQLTQQEEETNAVVYLMQVAAQDGQQSGAPKILPFPRSGGSSVSTSGDMNFQSITARTNIVGVNEWYSKQLGLPLAGSTLSHAGGGVTYRFSLIPGRLHPEVCYLRMKNRSFSFIHAIEKGSNATEVVVSTSSY